jgi:hypothetical protein
MAKIHMRLEVPLFVSAILLALAPIAIAQDQLLKKKDNETTTVISEGTGTSKQEALKDAIRNAVRQAVGAIVDAQTRIENDQVIEDKVIMFSEGIVKSFEEISTTEDPDNDGYKVRIKATVERQILQEKLKSAKVKEKTVDGKAMFAEVISQNDQDKDAADLILAHFRDFPKNVLSVDVEGKPKIVDRNDTSATVEVTVEVKADGATFRKFINDLHRKMKATVGSGKPIKIPFKPAGSGIFTTVFSADEQFKKLASILNEPLGLSKSGHLFLIAQSEKLGNKVDFQAYPLREEMATALNSAMTGLPKFKIALLDTEGEELRSCEFDTVTIQVPQLSRPTSAIFTGNLLSSKLVLRGIIKDKSTIFSLPPFFITNKAEGLVYVTPTLIKKQQFFLKLEDLAKLKSAEASIVDP